MRSPAKSLSRKRMRDAEAELNLPPGFRFHPTDEELVVHYLCPKAAGGRRHLAAATAPPPPSIIAEVDLYKHDPWDLPEMALFGTKEWYFFTPRDRKYPNGSRPNRAAGNGYWKATGADKPIRPKSTPNTTVGIKKALVFYAGKGPQGIKTNWIMHEYRLATPNRPTGNSTTHKLDDWVLCRLYNKKNDPDEKIITEVHHQNQNESGNHKSPVEEMQSNDSSWAMDSLNSLEDSDVEFGGITADKVQENGDLGGYDMMMFPGNFSGSNVNGGNLSSSWNNNNGGIKMEGEDDQYGNECLSDVSLEELQHFLEGIPNY